ncbi:MAG: type II secretion system protein [Phycisphaerales bacterium]|nr:type II secretion system protein [Phycisphaerales bacterium]
MRRRAFTLLELLVVVAIIALLVGILLPTLGGAREASRTAFCLNNVRSMQLAHWMYLEAHDGAFVDVGLAHGGVETNEAGSWIVTLSEFYETDLARQCPSDRSPHWPIDQGGAGEHVPESESALRRTSYGVNNYLTSFAPAVANPNRPSTILRFRNINQIVSPSDTVQFLEMTESGPFAGSDHPHVENWHIPGFPDAAPALATQHLETNQHGGEARTWAAKANYGFLDGHAATLSFEQVYTDLDRNRFDPNLQR